MVAIALSIASGFIFIIGSKLISNLPDVCVVVIIPAIYTQHKLLWFVLTLTDCSASKSHGSVAVAVRSFRYAGLDGPLSTLFSFKYDYQLFVVCCLLTLL